MVCPVYRYGQKELHKSILMFRKKTTQNISGSGLALLHTDALYRKSETYHHKITKKLTPYRYIDA